MPSSLSAPETPARPDLGTRQEYELKFPLANAQAPALVRWLKAHCVPHPEFPETQISSVYYDAPDQRLLDEKISSDYFKSKVRLRWYSPLPGRPSTSATFIEAKLKQGSRRTKLRFETGICREEVEGVSLSEPIFEKPLFMLREAGLSGIADLRPVFQINYRRLRFSHPFSSSVLCLDMDIRVPRVNHNRFRRVPWGTFPSAVLEQKGFLDRLDPVFSEIERFELHKTSFSKYMGCFFWVSGITQY